MLISVVIPAFNEAKLLGQSLCQIKAAFEANQEEPFSWEIIVCDNNSTDQTAAIAEQEGATVVFEPENQISRARNTGASKARGEWLLFIDADSFPRPGLIAEVQDLIRGGNHIGCGSTVTVEDASWWGKMRVERLNPSMRLLKWCGGVFILCHSEAFRSIGGFSTDLYAFEEIDFVLRLKRYGRKQQKKFAILHRYPVVTSGRRGELRVGAMVTLFVSTAVALLLLVINSLLPKKLRVKKGRRWLGYWYGPRR